MAGTPANIDLSALTIPTIKARDGSVDTSPEGRDGTRPGDGGGSQPQPAGIIFETDFSSDAGFELTGTSFPSRANKPQGFLSAHATGTSKLEVLPVGPGGSNAMRFNYSSTLSQPTATLIAALTDGPDQGYPELYFRFRMKFPDNFRFGDGNSTIPYWKWFRLAQNYDKNDVNMQSENRPDSYYVVGNISSSPTWGTRWNIAASGNEEDGTPQERSSGSSGGPHALLDWYAGTSEAPADRLGQFTHMPGWDIDWTTNKGRFKTFADGTPQGWHTVEFHVKAASAPGADDGVIEIFLDGANQGAWIRVEDQFSPDTGPFTGFPTAANPHGWNLISFFDNMTELNKDFGSPLVDGFVDVADLVVSTERIGHNYNVGGSQPDPVGVIFSESFDDQPDWNSGLPENNISTTSNPGGPDTEQRVGTHTIPEGWYSVRQMPEWAPSTGHSDRHEAIEIFASNADKARGGVGKSYVSYRDSYDAGWNFWASESILLKYFPEGYSQLYVEFYIRFSPNWTRTKVPGLVEATSKIFRVSSWNGQGSEFEAFSSGNLGPIALWDHSLNDFGMRTGLAFRGGPHGDNYKFTPSDIPDIGSLIISGSLGDINSNYTSNLSGMGKDGGSPNLINRVSGGALTGLVEHDAVFGAGDSWTKLGFFVKMNSVAGVKDGEFRMWLNDEQMFVSTQIPWIRPSETINENVKWNLVAIGGNDFFQTYPNEERHEEWYSIDDLVVRDSIPSELL